MATFTEILSKIDDFVWGPVMLILLVGTGIFNMAYFRICLKECIK